MLYIWHEGQRTRQIVHISIIGDLHYRRYIVRPPYIADNRGITVFELILKIPEKTELILKIPKKRLSGNTDYPKFNGKSCFYRKDVKVYLKFFEK